MSSFFSRGGLRWQSHGRWLRLRLMFHDVPLSSRFSSFTTVFVFMQARFDGRRLVLGVHIHSRGPSSWGPTLVQHIVSTDTKPCKRPAVVFYFLGLWCSPPFRAAAHSSCACPAPVLCCCILAIALGLTSLAATLLVAFLRSAAGVGASIGQVCVRPWPEYPRAGQLQLAPGQAAQGPVCAVSVGPIADGQARGSVSGCGAEWLIGGRGRILTGACSYDTCL